jgi:hypothetical protein
MITLLERKFTVNLPLEAAWDYLARVEEWPSWARHIKKIELQPPGELERHSSGVLHLKNGLAPTFRVTEFDPPRNWQWDGAFLWLTVLYGHRFEALDAAHTKLTWIIEAEGLGASILGPLFASLYRPSLDRAIPLLVQEMNAAGQGVTLPK